MVKTVARLFVTQNLIQGNAVPLERAQMHYLANVLRMADGSEITLFNGQDGEWRCVFRQLGKKAAAAEPVEQLRPQTSPADIEYAFAPLKHARLDFVAQKASELGVRAVHPVITERTVNGRIKMDRLQANLVEGAEQCGVLWVPEAHEPIKLRKFRDDFPEKRLLIFCDETADSENPITRLSACDRQPATILIGPEGGFSPTEAERIRSMPQALPISLGPRIMRADTAAVAALSLVQAVLGDWS